jgi:hypothetical protein
LSPVRAREIEEGKTFVELFGAEWTRDLFTKYANFVENIRNLLLAGQIAKDQAQAFDFDQRDDWRFREYLRKFYEPGQMAKTIKDAVVYCFANKCKKASDRQLILDQSALLKMDEPRVRTTEADGDDAAARAEAERRAREDAERLAKELAEIERLKAELARVKAKLAARGDLPSGHEEFFESSKGLPEGFKASFERLRLAYSSRFLEFPGVEGPIFEVPEAPPDLTEAHLECFNEVFGKGNLELSIMPSETQLTDQYFEVMYPETQRPEDTDRGLMSYHPDWFSRPADTSVVGPFPEAWTEEDDPRKTWFSAYRRSMTVASRQYHSSLILTETVKKPNLSDGKQQYTTKDDKPDPLTSILQEVFGETQTHRFSLSHDQWTTELIPNLKKRIIQRLTSKGLTPPNFEIILTPVIISNQQTTLSYPKNSQTNTYEWAADTLLKNDHTDSGRCLAAGRSGSGGAGFVGSGSRGDSWFIMGGRLSVVFPHS